MPRRIASSLVAFLTALAMGACHDQQTIEGTSSRMSSIIPQPPPAK